MKEEYLKFYNDKFDESSFNNVINILEAKNFSEEEIISLLSGEKLYHGNRCRRLFYIRIDVSKKYNLYANGINYYTYSYESNNPHNYDVKKSKDERNKRNILLKVEHTITDINILDSYIKELNMIENIFVEAYMPYRESRYNKSSRYVREGIQIRCNTSDLQKCPEIANLIRDILGDYCPSILAVRIFGVIVYDSLFTISYPTTNCGIIIEKKGLKSIDQSIELLKASVDQLEISNITEGSRAWRITFTAPHIYPKEVFNKFKSQNIESIVVGNTSNMSFYEDDLGPSKWRIVPHKQQSSFDDEENVMRGISSGNGEYYGK